MLQLWVLSRWRRLAGTRHSIVAACVLFVLVAVLSTSPGPAVAHTPDAVAGWAQDSAPTEAHPVRIGVLTLGTAQALQPGWDHYFVRQLAERGFVEGQNLAFEWRTADGDATRLPELAADLVAQDPDVIFAAFTPAVLAARQATSTIPIVIPFGGDPVGTGLIQSFDHPGTNVTGMSDPSWVLMPDLVRLLATIAPGRHRVAIFTPPANPAIEAGLQASRDAATQLGEQILRVDIVTPTEQGIDAAFDAAASQQADGFVFYYTPTTSALDRRAAEAAARNHLAGVFETRGAVDVGGLMSESVDYTDSFTRAADYVADILGGADPSELAVGLPERFELVINLRTAQTLGLTIPTDLVERASDVIR